MSACDYAGCTRVADTDIDGWAFCRHHLREHRLLAATDRQVAATRGPRPKPPPPAHAWLAARYDGQRQPSRSWEPLLDVMQNPERRQVAS